MRRRGIAIISLAGLAFAAAVTSAWCVRCHRVQPTFAGEPLSTWMSRYWAQNDPREAEDAAAAIRAMGEAAGPRLADWMRYESSPAKQKLQALFDHVPLPCSWRISFAPSAAEVRAEQSLGAFCVLGPAASNAVPRLLNLLVDTRAPESARRAMRALSQIREPALGPLLGLLADSRAPNRDLAAFAIAGMELDRCAADQALPFLLKCATDPDAAVAETALFALGELDVDPDTAVPALLAKVKDPHPELRSRAAYSLAKYANAAHRDAITRAVRLLLTDPDQDTREAATNVLAQIAPELLTQ